MILYLFTNEFIIKICNSLFFYYYCKKKNYLISGFNKIIKENLLFILLLYFLEGNDNYESFTL